MNSTNSRADIEASPGVSIGQWFHDELTKAVVFETAPWALERVARVVATLDPHRPDGRHLQVVIPWLLIGTAFTVPGPYIFFDRSLYQLCPDDETTAFVIAHEMAHHDLGHMALMPAWMGRLARRWGGEVAVLVTAAVERRLYGPERECAADAYALDLCVNAGYAPERCLDLFRILENYYLDHGDLRAVFGTDVESNEELEPSAPLLTKVRIWAYQRQRGHLPVRDRAFTLRRHARLPTP